MKVKDFMEENKLDYGNIHLHSPILWALYTKWKMGALHLDTEKQFTDFMGFIYYTARSELAAEYDQSITTE